MFVFKWDFCYKIFAQNNSQSRKQNLSYSRLDQAAFLEYTIFWKEKRTTMQEYCTFYDICINCHELAWCATLLGVYISVFVDPDSDPYFQELCRSGFTHENKGLNRGKRCNI